AGADMRAQRRTRGNAVAPRKCHDLTAPSREERIGADQKRVSLLPDPRDAAAFRFIRDPARRDDVVRTIVETTGLAEANARISLALYFEPERNVLPRQGEIDVKGFETAIEFMGEAGVLKEPLPPPERFVDLQYLHAPGA